MTKQRGSATNPVPGSPKIANAPRPNLAAHQPGQKPILPPDPPSMLMPPSANTPRRPATGEGFFDVQPPVHNRIS